MSLSFLTCLVFSFEVFKDFPLLRVFSWVKLFGPFFLPTPWTTSKVPIWPLTLLTPLMSLPHGIILLSYTNLPFIYLHHLYTCNVHPSPLNSSLYPTRCLELSLISTMFFLANPIIISKPPLHFYIWNNQK